MQQYPMEWFSKSRMDAMVDGIFAFSMTLLVAGLILPTVITDTTPAMSFSDMLPAFFVGVIYFGIAFFTMHNYWLYHHFHSFFITRQDMVSIRIVIVTLFFVALMPVSTAVSAFYRANPHADIFIEANLLAIGLFFLLHWRYATKDARLTDKTLSPLFSCIAFWKGCVVPGVSVVAIIVALFAIPWSILCYITIPFFEWFVEWYCRSVTTK